MGTLRRTTGQLEALRSQVKEPAQANYVGRRLSWRLSIDMAWRACTVFGIRKCGDKVARNVFVGRRCPTYAP